jgi:C_GCAxxG_C_C family probable redox protein
MEQEIAMGRVEQAVKCFNSSFNCSQSVFSVFCEELGLETEKALKIATAFGGGMGHTGETCGAVTGAYMAIGLKHGKYKALDNLSKEKTYSLVMEFSRRFKDVYGSVCCTELLGYDLGTKEGMESARKKDLFNTLCVDFVKNAVEILEQIL